MLLYATTTSERASKGQGGNKYLNIAVKDESERVQFLFTVINNGDGTCTASLKDIDDLRPSAWKKTWILKGNKQKGDICNFNACQNTAVHYGVCDKHRGVEQ